MSLDSYTNLKTSVADWLNRADLTSVIPDFITLCEAALKRDLHRTTKLNTIYVATAAVNPPTDMNYPISLTLSSASPTQDRPLRIVTPQMLAEIRANHANVAGRPIAVAYYDGQFQFAPAPDQSYDCLVVYVKNFTALSGSNATNEVLTEAPDCYLYGTLLAAAPYLEHDERIPVWQKKYQDAVDSLNAMRDEEEYHGGLTEVRLPFTIG